MLCLENRATLISLQSKLNVNGRTPNRSTLPWKLCSCAPPSRQSPLSQLLNPRLSDNTAWRQLLSQLWKRSVYPELDQIRSFHANVLFELASDAQSSQSSSKLWVRIPSTLPQKVGSYPTFCLLYGGVHWYIAYIRLIWMMYLGALQNTMDVWQFLIIEAPKLVNYLETLFGWDVLAVKAFISLANAWFIFLFWHFWKNLATG